MKYKSLSLLLFVVTFSTACGDKKEQGASNKLEKDVETGVVIKESKAPRVVVPKVEDVKLAEVDIMKPLNGLDPCFEAVELIRDNGDVAMFKDLGDSILLKEDELVTDSHRTYFALIGKMLKENKTIAEIRGSLLETCRLLKK